MEEIEEIAEEQKHVTTTMLVSESAGVGEYAVQFCPDHITLPPSPLVATQRIKVLYFMLPRRLLPLCAYCVYPFFRLQAVGYLVVGVVLVAVL